MACTYSVPGSYLGTSPLTRSTPIPFGGKASRTAPISAPLPSARGSGAGASARDSFIDGRSGEDYQQQRYSLSSSGRRLSQERRLSIASSPSSAEASSRTFAADPPQATFGFSVGGFSEASGFTFPTRSTVAVASRTGLLSKALSDAPDAIKEHDLLPLPSEPSRVDPLAFFPGIPLDLLHEAQAKHACFRNEVVVTAYGLAARAHQNQLRKGGDSILSHCVQVAMTLAGLGLDADTVAAGLLHESTRSNTMSRSQLEEFMPQSVVNVLDRVDTISEMSRLYRQHSGSFKQETFSRMLVAMEDVRAVLIKLADRIHNMRTIRVLPIERQEALARETLEVYSAVANRLGVWCLKAELEDLAFSVLHPEEYTFLKNAVGSRQEPAALEATINSIKGALQAQNVAYEDISGRPKNLYGIYTKLVKDGKPVTAASLGTVYDLIALRVVVASKHDCYTALRAVQSVYRTMPERSKDFIRDIKKPNGYQSLHETVYGEGDVPVEVQIRTHKMHYIAEYGFAAHWKYKEKLDSEDEWLEKETQYKRWLTQYKLGLHDKKVRPEGSPPTDGSLRSLGVAYLDVPEEQQGELLDPFLRHQRFKLQVPVKTEVSVLLQTHDGISSRDYPLGTTANQLWRQLGLGQQPGYALTVNSRLPCAEAALQSGDLVQVLPLSTVLSRSPPQERYAPSNWALEAVAEEWTEELDAEELAPHSSEGAFLDDILEVYGRQGMTSWRMGPHTGTAVPLAGV
ncbi:putative guanosine-3',5'-bis(diphosphate) 3'-pyrophosphohydrolase [Tetrabaena socialis]|uniref:Putative guanosine-3',5'-bis(Diphosphate) 3'-pyrophosphohydrolase n=1 Tax=Tetrabaena socialis TaxID=47790 RepID=A0A2J8A1L9_9CHLO|nr:putative guanosine-3',5'-bis(diphosphate) 3'-pyrophosphohydrolase [Tetrabaena socialis]|eukprot:PNH06426.1 putative guanosine-3',5'-bis(diphosphate) 3'-pyrophosphohydrolase [Tetrabaena socialis]